MTVLSPATRDLQDRIAGLDGLRGIAALTVLFHHVFGRFTQIQLLGEGYLSVDFFFMLSGLVIARGWEARMATSGVSNLGFLKARYVRLAPMMVIGISFGAIVLLIDGSEPHLIAMYFLMQIVFVPRWWGRGPAFPLDGVQWSLFFELAANALHVLLLRRMSNRMLGGLIFASAMLLATVSAIHHNLAVGDYAPSFANGLPRVLFSYATGVALHRASLTQGASQWLRFDWKVVATLFVASIIAADCARIFVSRSLVDPFVVLLVWPLLLSLGLRSRVSVRSLGVTSLLGGVSYPLYALHAPMLDAVAVLHQHYARMSDLACAGLAGGGALSGACLVYWNSAQARCAVSRAVATLIHQRTVKKSCT